MNIDGGKREERAKARRVRDFKGGAALGQQADAIGVVAAAVAVLGPPHGGKERSLARLRRHGAVAFSVECVSTAVSER